MLPVLLNLGFLKIYTFGLFLVLAFFWAAFLLWRNIRLTSYKEEDVFDGLFLGLAGALFFGRLLYVFFNFGDFGLSILKFILLNGYPGLSLYGAFFGGLAVLYIFASVRKIKFKELIDYFVPSFFLALALGKLGAFFSGAEIGSATKFILSLKYFGFQGSRHLTSLYESILFFLAVPLSQKMLFDIRREKYPHGLLVYFCLWSLSIIYFVFDKLKGSHLYFLGQSFNQIVSLVILLTTSLYFLYYFRSEIKNHVEKTFKKIRETAKRTIRKR